MAVLMIALFVAAVFGVCWLVDKAFSKSFRSKVQHQSGLAVRVNKRYGVFGIGLSILGVLAICVGANVSPALLFGGIFVLLMGLCLGIYFLTHGIFYDGESFLVTSLLKKDRVYRYEEILQQRLYQVQGGGIIVELHMTDGTAVSVPSSMDGAFLFLDTAFAGWCLQKNVIPQNCDFHDPSKSWWFPHDEEV